MLNCKQINKHSIYDYLKENNCTLKSEDKYKAMFLSPLRNEKTASFKVNKTTNTWYDFGLATAKGGTFVDLLKEIHQCSVKEVLELYNNNNPFSFPKQFKKEQPAENPIKPKQELLKVKNIENAALLQYLASRKIDTTIAQGYCKEIYYKNNDKYYFSIGFENISNGFEMRNKYFKNCYGKKNISLIENGNSTLSIFEGFMDFLSYKTLKLGNSEDFLILNSISLYDKANPYLEKYKSLKLFLDNDKAGKKLTEEILRTNSDVKDFSSLYKNFKDLNEYLNNQKNKNIRKRKISR